MRTHPRLLTNITLRAMKQSYQRFKRNRKSSHHEERGMRKTPEKELVRNPKMMKVFDSTSENLVVGSTLSFSPWKHSVCIETMIAKGGFGKVFKASNGATHNLSVHYAVKQVVHATGESPSAEAIILKKVHNQNIIHLLGVKETSRSTLMLFPYLPRSLAEEIHSRRLTEDIAETDRCPLSEIDLLYLIQGIANGLKALHTACWSHCDLKPENILLKCHPSQGVDHRLVPIISDLGSARSRTSVCKSPKELEEVKHWIAHMTTLEYRAPELFFDDKMVDSPPVTTIDWAKCDIWSLGCIMFVSMYGASPLEIEWAISTVPLHEADATIHIVATKTKNIHHIPFPPNGSAADRRYSCLITDLLRRTMLQVGSKDRLESSSLMRALRECRRAIIESNN